MKGSGPTVCRGSATSPWRLVAISWATPVGSRSPTSTTTAALDLVISNNPGDCGCDTAPATVLRNNVGAKRNWLAVDLVGVRCNRDAVGAEVVAEIDPAACAGKPRLAKQVRLASAGCSYASQHGSRLYFGLDDLPRVDRLTIRWPGGGEEIFRDVKAGQLVRITQGQGMEAMPLPSKRAVAARPNGSR